MPNTSSRPLVAVIMGSQSDWPIMKRACDALDELNVSNEARIASAHRTPDRLIEYLAECEAGGTKVFIAGAGVAAHLPGVVASKTTLPVLGVPMESGPLKGMDSLLSIVQMPGGIPVGTLAIGGAGAKNAGLLAASILSVSDPDLGQRLKDYRKAMADALPFHPED